MNIESFIISVNTAGTLAIGAICFFIAYTTFKGIEDETVQEFSKRFMMSIAVLLLFVSYIMMYFTFLSGHPLAIYPFYILLIAVFVYLVWAAVAFEDVAQTYGSSQEDKLEKMENEELGGR